MKTLISLCKSQSLQIINPKDPKFLKKSGFFFVIALIIGGYLCGYCFFAAYYLSKVGLLDLLPAAIFTIASLMALVSSVHRVEGTLIHLQDDAILYALPLSKRTILLSRLIPMYVETLLVLVVIFIPCMLAMSYFGNIAFDFYLRLIGLLPFAPMLPLALGILTGLIIHQISQRFRHSKYITILLTFAFVFIVYYYAFQMQNIENPTSIFEMISQMLASIYPLSQYFVDFLIHSDWIALLLYLAVQAISMAVIIAVISRTQANTTIKLTVKKSGGLKVSYQNSVLKALYKKEFRRYLSSVPYVTNTAIIYVLLLGVTIYLQFQDLDTVLQFLEIAEIKPMIVSALPLMIGFLIGSGTTTGCSISMEGKYFWQNKVLPVKPQTIFLSKILVNLTLSLPTLLIASLLLSHSLALNLQELMTVLILPALQAVLYSQLGLIFNIWIPHLSWESEMKAVKQGMAQMLVILSAMAFSFIPIGLMQTAVLPSTAILSVIAVITVIGITLCTIYLLKFASQKFQSI